MLLGGSSSLVPWQSFISHQLGKDSNPVPGASSSLVLSPGLSHSDALLPPVICVIWQSCLLELQWDQSGNRVTKGASGKEQQVSTVAACDFNYPYPLVFSFCHQSSLHSLGLSHPRFCSTIPLQRTLYLNPLRFPLSLYCGTVSLSPSLSFSLCPGLSHSLNVQDFNVR